jgi:hypothetical protein
VTIRLPTFVLISLLALWPQTTTAQSSELMNAYHKALSLQKNGQYKEAIPFAKSALEISEREFGPNHENIATMLSNLAWLYLSLGQYKNAEKFFLRELEIRLKKNGPSHPDTADSINDLSEVYMGEGRYLKATLHYFQFWENERVGFWGLERGDEKKVFEILALTLVAILLICFVGWLIWYSSRFSRLKLQNENGGERDQNLESSIDSYFIDTATGERLFILSRVLNSPGRIVPDIQYELKLKFWIRVFWLALLFGSILGGGVVNSTMESEENRKVYLILSGFLIGILLALTPFWRLCSLIQKLEKSNDQLLDKSIWIKTTAANLSYRLCYFQIITCLGFIVFGVYTLSGESNLLFDDETMFVGISLIFAGLMGVFQLTRVLLIKKTL